MLRSKNMLHTNRGELCRLFDTFCRVWGAGGDATFTTSTQEGKLRVNLDIQLGSATAACPGAPTLRHQRPSAWTSTAPTSASGHPGAGQRCHRRRHRGPAAKARSNARAAAHQAFLATAKASPASVLAPPPPPPLPPPGPTQRLVKVIERKAGSRSSFWQLDGEGGSEVEIEKESKSEVYCIFCPLQPRPVEPSSFIEKFGMKPKVNISCSICNVKGSDVGVCLNCHCIYEAHVYGVTRCQLCLDAKEWIPV